MEALGLKVLSECNHVIFSTCYIPDLFSLNYLELPLCRYCMPFVLIRTIYFSVIGGSPPLIFMIVLSNSELVQGKLRKFDL